jgi:uncharacterized protein (TIGR02217 family)
MARIEFDEVRFPEDVSFGSSGGPTFKTSIFEAYRGGEKRNIDWASPLMEFDVAYGIKTDEQMARVIAFFNARQGKLRGFRYKNWANYQIINDNIAIGDGLSNRLPIIRTYGFPATQTYKRLYKIVLGSVSGVRIGNETLVEGEDYAIDYNSGEIIFSADRIPGEGTPIKVTNLEFDEPVRFDIDNLNIVIEAFNNNSISQLPLVGIRDNFTTGTLSEPDAFTATRYSANDPFYGSTRLLLKFDDTGDLSTTTDESRYQEPLTMVPPATLRTDTVVAGSGSLTFGATGYLTADGARFDLSDPNLPFTCETFIRRPVGLVGETQQLIFGKWDETGSTRGYQLVYQPSEQRLLYFVSSDGAASTIVLNYPWTEGEDNTWQHISLDRLSTGLHVLRINGNVVQTALNPGAVNDPAVTFNIGGWDTPSAGQGSFQGDIDSFRFTYARNRYPGTGKINPPQPDYPT